MGMTGKEIVEITEKVLFAVLGEAEGCKPDSDGKG